MCALLSCVPCPLSCTLQFGVDLLKAEEGLAVLSVAAVPAPAREAAGSGSGSGEGGMRGAEEASARTENGGAEGPEGVETDGSDKE